jgi:hypothetical protein
VIRFIERITDRIHGKAPKGSSRSWFWRDVRDRFLKENPQCVVCGSTKNLIAHHIVSFHLAPDLELDPTNLITLCETQKTLNCHLVFGHLGDFRKINPSVLSDAAQWSVKLRRKR